MTPCYTCSDKAVKAANLKTWKPVCGFHLKEVIEEEDYLELMSMEKWEATQHGQALSAS